MPRSSSTTRNKKRLVVLSDGTWQSPENPVPTNILNLTKAILREDPNRMPQVTLYDSGIGTEGAFDKIVGGGLGEGIDFIIKELYTFLVLNYDEGDEVILFGFSRGSYTVRSLCGLIYEAGLLRRDQIQFIKEAYDLYRKNKDADSEEAVSFRKAHGDRIPIKLLVCFDTVGALGLPLEIDAPDFLSRFNPDNYRFHNTTLNPLIEHAIHMLSIDEDRAVFSPTLMEPSEVKGEEQLTQLYFWGTHGGIGGGDSRQLESSKITLRFCVEEIQRRGIGLAFNMDMIPEYGNIEEEAKEIEYGKVMECIAKYTGKYVRPIPFKEIHETALKRYERVEDWRPAALDYLSEIITIPTPILP